jgi:hypothetical protein
MDIPTVGPSVDKAIPWLYTVGQTEASTLVVPGSTPEARTGFYNALEARALPGVTIDRKQPREWLQVAPIDDWTARVGRLGIPDECLDMLPKAISFPLYSEWTLLWALASLDDFIIEEPLRSMVDQKHYLLHEAARMLLEFRFLLREGPSYEVLLETLRTFVRWLTMCPLDEADIQFLTRVGVNRRVTSLSERIDLLIFFLTLASQNAIIHKTVFVFDALEAACSNKDRPKLRELHMMMRRVSRWSKSMETPIGFILGFDHLKLPLLQRTHEKLCLDVTSGLKWSQ